MIDKNLTRLAAAAVGVLALLAGPARADFIPIAMPDAAYLGGTTGLGFAAPDFSILTSLTDGTQTASFDIGTVALTVPTTWASLGRAAQHRVGDAARAVDERFYVDGDRSRTALIHLRL